MRREPRSGRYHATALRKAAPPEAGGSHSQATMPGARRGPSPLRGRRFPVELLTRAEVEALIAACSRRAKTGIRNRALIALLYRCGLRLGEALALRPVDVNADAGTVRVLHAKGDRSRTVGIDAGALALLERWLELRRELDLERSPTIFCTLAGRPLHASYVRQLMPRLARRAEITKRVHAHGLRHAHAVELLREGVPLTVIRKQLGHADLSTTDVYLDHLMPSEVVDTIRRREWYPAAEQQPQRAPASRGVRSATRRDALRRLADSRRT